MVLSEDSGAAVTGQCLWLGLSHYPTVSSLGFKVIQVATVVISRAPKPAPMHEMHLTATPLVLDMLPGWDLRIISHLF